MSKFKELTEEQDAALQHYAEYFGDEWKTQLADDWMRAGTSALVEWGPLQQLRNSHGPRWLANLK